MSKVLKERKFPVKSVLAMACAIFRQKGYTSTSTHYQDGHPTYTNKDMLIYEFFKDLQPKDYLLSFKPTEEDEETAEAIIKYYRRLTFGVIGNDLNDYLKRLFTVTQSEDTVMGDFGVLASVPNAYEREQIEREVKSQIKDTVKEHLGKEGETIYLNIKYIKTRFIPSLNCYAHEAVTDTNHLVSFLNKIELGKQGTVQKIRARVKKHGANYTTKTPETQLNYVKALDTELVWQ